MILPIYQNTCFLDGIFAFYSYIYEHKDKLNLLFYNKNRKSFEKKRFYPIIQFRLWWPNAAKYAIWRYTNYRKRCITRGTN